MTSAPKLLTKKEIKKLATKFPEWKLDAKETKFTKTFEFEKQIDALIFIARSTVNSEVLKHYPDIMFTHCKVKVVVTTHERKALTKLDSLLIKKVELVALKQEVDKK